MTQHALALTNLLTFLLEHHAEDIGSVIYGHHGASVSLKSPPKGRTMLGWSWEPSFQRGQLVHTTPSGILVFAPEFQR